jgi:hypothetical protein
MAAPSDSIQERLIVAAQTIGFVADNHSIEYFASVITTESTFDEFVDIIGAFIADYFQIEGNDLDAKCTLKPSITEMIRNAELIY